MGIRIIPAGCMPVYQAARKPEVRVIPFDVVNGCKASVAGGHKWFVQYMQSGGGRS